MQHFFQVFSGDDIIICPSASCVLTIRHHYPKLVESSTDTANLQRLQPLVFDFTEWLFSQLPLPVSLIWPGRVFLHHSCAARQLGILTKLQHLLSLVGNLQIAEISPAYSCCGFGGLFSLKRPNLSQAIGSNYLKTMFSTNPTAFVSPDVGCLLHLQGILRATGQTFPMYHTAELICQSVKVSESAFSPEPFSSS
jgi:L-lactate dehydrogenase complex protein LldE